MSTAGNRPAPGPRPNRALPLLLLGLLAACAAWLGWDHWRSTPPKGEEEPAASPWFADVTEEVGLDFVHDPGPVGRYFMPQIMGSGAALFDCDGDGLLDIYLVQNGGPKGAKNRLYRQLPGGKFKDVSAGSGLDVAGYGMGVAVGDVNNDGRPDVLVTEFGRLRLFLNRGNGKFEDITRKAGLDSPAWGTSAAFFDYNRDGWLDLVVVNYVDYNPSADCADAAGRRDYCHPGRFRGSPARLYRNRKEDPPRFEDVTVKAGLAGLPGPGLGVVCADFNGDGWPDIFVANDAQANRLWINRKGERFVDEALDRGVAYNEMGQPQANMGVALADLDGDGLADLFVTHLTEETHTLWAQRVPGLFRDRTTASGLARTRWRGTGFGTAAADFDLDGAPDLAVVNGRVARGGRGGAPGPAVSAASFWAAYEERNQLFANDGRGQFRDVSPFNAAFCGRPDVARGLCCGDVNGDGALDLLVTCVAGRARLYRNVAPRRGHWLLVRALDPDLKRDAYGARVTVRAGGKRWVGLINPGQSYLSSHDPRAHFGLGAAARVEGIRVHWPDGRVEDFEGRPADQAVVLCKGDGERVEE